MNDENLRKEESWIDGHAFEDIVHLDAGFEGCVPDGWTDRLKKPFG